jgi:hypothetical protein
LRDAGTQHDVLPCIVPIVEAVHARKMGLRQDPQIMQIAIFLSMRMWRSRFDFEVVVPVVVGAIERRVADSRARWVTYHVMCATAGCRSIADLSMRSSPALLDSHFTFIRSNSNCGSSF